MKKAYVDVAIQCRAANGEIGSFFFIGDSPHEYKPVSPVFKDLAELFPWARENGWRPLPGTYATHWGKE